MTVIKMTKGAMEPIPQAILDVIDERLRQIRQEGWSYEHDDQHKNGELSKAAACYATGLSIFDVCGNELWPWERRWDKRNRHDRRRQLVIAGALILAEIERLDRQAAVDAMEGEAPRLMHEDVRSRVTEALAEVERESNRLNRADEARVRRKMQ